MAPENENLEPDEIPEKEIPAPEGGFATARSGGKAEVTLRLLTQEEFDRLEKERKEKAAAAEKE